MCLQLIIKKNKFKLTCNRIKNFNENIYVTKYLQKYRVVAVSGALVSLLEMPHFKIFLHCCFLFTNLINYLLDLYITHLLLSISLVFFLSVRSYSPHILQNPFQDLLCHFPPIILLKIDSDLNMLYLAIFKIILVFANLQQLNNLKFILKLLQLLLHDPEINTQRRTHFYCH